MLWFNFIHGFNLIFFVWGFDIVTGGIPIKMTEFEGVKLMVGTV